MYFIKYKFNICDTRITNVTSISHIQFANLRVLLFTSVIYESYSQDFDF